MQFVSVSPVVTAPLVEPPTCAPFPPERVALIVVVVVMAVVRLNVTAR